MAIYRFKLKPLEPFFFGGEKHTVEGERILNEYYMKSLYYPQQTTLLGMLRFLLLKLTPEVFNGTYITDKEGAARLIGPLSFDGVQESFGFIKKLSPLYFWENKMQRIYHIAPRDLFLKTTEKTEHLDINYVKIDGQQPLHFFSGAVNKLSNSKTHYDSVNLYLVDEKGEFFFRLDNLFDTHDRIGIETHKPQPGSHASEAEDQEDKYYRQVFYSFKIEEEKEDKKESYDWYFMFEAEIIDSFSFPTNENGALQPQFVQLGGERVHFRLEIEKSGDKFYKPTSLYKEYERKQPLLWLLSDAYLDPEKQKECSFAFTQYSSFRHLMASINATQHYSALAKTKERSFEQIKRSELYNLLQRGSVFYFKDDNQRNTFIQALQENKAFYNIGFNQFSTHN